MQGINKVSPETQWQVNIKQRFSAAVFTEHNVWIVYTALNENDYNENNTMIPGSVHLRREMSFLE